MTREERKVVTVLFADLAGSTPLAEALDAEDVKLIVGGAVARMVDEVEALGGFVKDLAGDGVLAFFGAPQSYEDDAERAARAALQIVAAIRNYGQEVERGWGVEGLAARVGVTTGPVVLGAVGAGERIEYGAFGDTVNTAARLQGASEPGSAVVDGATRRLVEPLFVWGETRELDLKGKAEPVSASLVVSALAPGAKARGLEGVHVELVARAREIGELRAAAAALREGIGGIAFLTGEAGLGKSRLLLELRGMVDEGTQWLEGRCVSYGESLPYWPYRDLVREWLRLGPTDPELRARVSLKRRLAELFPQRSADVYPYIGAMLGLALEPDAAARLNELSPEALQYRTFEVVGELLGVLAEQGPLAVIIDDLHWADATSLQLTESVLPLVERSPILFVIAQRPERDHGSWHLKELAQREFPHAARELALDPLPEEGENALLRALLGGAALPPELARRMLDVAEGNPFYLEELVRSLVDAGALVRADVGSRFDHEVPFEIPTTIEKVILARLDRLPDRSRDVVTAASALGRQFGLPLLEGVLGSNRYLHDALHELQRLDLLRVGRRWPEPEYRFKHALIQETAYRTLLTEQRESLHERAARWLEAQYAEHDDEVLGLLAYHWQAAAHEDKAIDYLTRAGDRARQEYALDEAIEYYRDLLPLLERRGATDQIAGVLFKLALALHTAMRFEEANDVYQRAFGFFSPPQLDTAPTATLQIATTVVPTDSDPLSAIAWPNIQLCMQLFDRLVEAGADRTLLPALAERWDIDADGLRYVFYLRDGLRWSDGMPLTAHDVEFGIKRLLNPDRPGASVSVYFVLENAQDYYLRRHDDLTRIGVRALDDRTVEFRLAARAPYFLSVLNRPDAGPQPRHAIEQHGDAWADVELQVVSGPFRRVEATPSHLVLERRQEYAGLHAGNVKTIEVSGMPLDEAFARYRRGDVDLIPARYTPHAADAIHEVGGEADLGAPTWSCYFAFRHDSFPGNSTAFRRALAHGIDRDALAGVFPAHLIAATGGIVPPALQGHTPDIALRFDPDLSRELMRTSGFDGPLAVANIAGWDGLLEPLVEQWSDIFGFAVELIPWDMSSEAPVYAAGWLPGYPDPEYFLRLLLHSNALTNAGGFSYAPFDELIEQARHETSDRPRLERFHDADRMAVVEQAALIPIVYGRSLTFVKPHVHGWAEFGKSSRAFADLVVEATQA